MISKEEHLSDAHFIRLDWWISDIKGEQKTFLLQSSTLVCSDFYIVLNINNIGHSPGLLWAMKKNDVIISSLNNQLATVY